MSIAGPAHLVEQYTKKLEDHFKMKRLGDLNVFVGLEVRRNRDERTFLLSETIHQHCSTTLQHARPVSVPIPTGKFYTTAEDNDERASRQLYQSMVGSIMSKNKNIHIPFGFELVTQPRKLLQSKTYNAPQRKRLHYQSSS